MAVIAEQGRGPEYARRSAATTGLLEVEPDLEDLVPEEQRAAAADFKLPLATVERGTNAQAVIEDSGAFGALILDGLLLETIQLGEHETLRLIGPGEPVPLDDPAYSAHITDARLLATARTRLVLLGMQFLVAAHRWPWVVVCLHRRMLEQSARLRMQLAICQLPRVDDRLVAMMRLLAEPWGRVTPTGIRLELTLSHEILGGLVGAARPTVTIALKALADSGELIKQDGAWLISDDRSAPPSRTRLQAPRLLPDGHPDGHWAPPPGLLVQSPVLPALDLGRILERCVYDKDHAHRLQEQAQALCERSRQLLTLEP